MRICIVAEHASKRFGGEAILPFHYFRVLRQRGLDVRLVVHSRTRDELTRLFPDDLDRLLFVEDLALHKLLFQASRLLPRRVSESTFGLANQLLTQLCQRRIVRRLVKAGLADVLHQPIPVAPRFPSLLSGLGIPLVVGPLNGGMEYPPAFRTAESALSRAFVSLGRSLSNSVNTLLPGKKNAALVLVANQRTRAVLPHDLRGAVVEIPENGVDLEQWSAPDNTAAPDSSRPFLFIGRLVDWKALDIALEAVQRTAGALLDIIGDGPMLAVWKAEVDRLGLNERVRFLGFQSQEVCAQHLGRALALVLPSIYECGGAVVLEAMAMGRPVIATDWGGPADYLDADCGIVIEPRNREFLVAGFADAMRRLIEDPALGDRMGIAGRQKLVREYDWEKKVDRMLLLYASVLGRNPA